MLPSSALKVILGLISLINLANGLHFYLKTGETKCFFEDMSKDTLLVSKIEAYELQEHLNEYIRNSNLRLLITVDVSIKRGI
ncbi:uncharacterized protein PRCAT00000705001 [Priceomyces carsonii]|uniref:uncharacterized protein n=1 Tax=Priceomyces carsonii TaxID=28549 RepID=UPI002ED8F2D9|nr:unnamed protein product [Priceomyces carsonii]